MRSSRAASSCPHCLLCRCRRVRLFAMIPAELLPEQVEAARNELGVEAEAVLELGGWKTSRDNVPFCLPATTPRSA